MMDSLRNFCGYFSISFAFVSGCLRFKVFLTGQGPRNRFRSLFFLAKYYILQFFNMKFDIYLFSLIIDMHETVEGAVIDRVYQIIGTLIQSHIHLYTTPDQNIIILKFYKNITIKVYENITSYGIFQRSCKLSKNCAYISISKYYGAIFRKFMAKIL